MKFDLFNSITDDNDLKYAIHYGGDIVALLADKNIADAIAALSEDWKVQAHPYVGYSKPRLSFSI